MLRKTLKEGRGNARSLHKASRFTSLFEEFSPSTTEILLALITELSAKAQEAVVRTQEEETSVPAQKGELVLSKL